MIHLFRCSLPALVALVVGQAPFSAAALAQESSASTTPFARALDRAVLRIQRRSDLQQHRGAGFNRDSFDVQALLGLGRTRDSTVIGWFTGFASYIQQADSTVCSGLMKGEPTASAIAALPSAMDSTDVERWTRHWESAVVASYLAPPPQAVDEEVMMVAIFSLIAKLPGAEMSFNQKPSSKPRKMNAEAECNTMRHFFKEALAMEEPTRMTLLRGLAISMSEKGKSLNFGQP